MRQENFKDYPDPGMGRTEALTGMILTFLQRNYSSLRILLYKYISHEFKSAHHQDFYWYGGKRSKAGRQPKRVLKELEATETELEQPGIEADIMQADVTDDSPISNKEMMDL